MVKEEKSSIPDEDEIEELRTELDKLLEEKKALFEPIFGSGFDTTFKLPLESAETLSLKKEREETIAALRAGDTNKGEDGKRGGIVGGSYDYSENLGVILDVSGSMTKFIEPLKEEIAQSFESPRYCEVNGCDLRLRKRYPSSALRTVDYRRAMEFIEELLVVYGVDTVYWFTDLNDDQELSAQRHLLRLLTRTGAAFHIKSVGKSPPEEPELLITDFQQE